MKRFFRQAYLTFITLAAVGVIAVISLVFFLQVQHLNTADRWLNHSEDTMESSLRLLNDINNMESSLRAYFITGEQTYLDDYHAKIVSINQRISQLKFLMLDNQVQIRNVNTLSKLLEKRIAISNFFVNMRSKQNLLSVLDFVRKNKFIYDYSKFVSDDTKQVARQIVYEEKNLLAERNEKLISGISKITSAGTAGDVVSLIVILICLLLLNRELFVKNLTQKKLESSEEKLRKLAYFDPLTGLNNRVSLFDYLHNIKQNKPLSLLYLDIDNFKNINDTFGHDVGDKLLQNIAARMTSMIGGFIFISRIGEDEFVIISDLTKNEEITLFSQKILSVMMIPFKINNQEIICTASIGICIFPTNALDGKTLLKNADIAMYKAKELGKNNYIFCTNEMSREVEERAKLCNQLYNAVSNKEFFVMYQPKLSLITSEASGVEALIRWDRPDLGMVYPGEFISLAENNGLINPIGEWMLRTVCNQANEWRKLGFQVPNVAINVSLREFVMRDFAIIVKNILAETNFDPSRLEIEITESTLMEKSANNINALKFLKSLGIKITIDDFGTGYSSLSYLNSFPIDKLKIDRSFVAQIASKQEPVIIGAIISMAHSLGIKVIAEGVETKDQFDFLKNNRCDEIQGYYYSRPLSSDDIKEFFVKDKEAEFHKKKSPNN